MNRKNFIAALTTVTLAPFINFGASKDNSPLFYQVDLPTFMVFYPIEGKGVTSVLQQHSFAVSTFRVKTSFKNWIDTMRKDNHVVVYDWWVQEAPTAPFDSAVIIRAALLNKSIPYIMSGFKQKFNYTLDKK